MTWTYDPALASNRDRLRFAVGDTEAADPLLLNAELDALLAAHGGVVAAAIAALEGLASRYARLANVSEGGASAQLAGLAVAFERRAERLRATGTALGAGPLLTAVTTRGDGSRRGPAFTRTLGDHAGGGSWPPGDAS